MLNRRQFIGASVTGLASLTTGGFAAAQTPAVDRPTRILVGFPPGGSADVVTRLLIDQLRTYASAIVVDNRPGAGGRMALNALKAAPADGTAMVVTPGSMIVIYPHVYKSLGYDPLTDFIPVSSVCASPFLLSVGPMVPAEVKTVADFVAWCRANPKLASYGSSGAGTMPHFTGVMLARDAKLAFEHVPYKGAAPAMQDLLGGQVAANIGVLANALPHIQAGALRALATSGATRSSFLPNVPTFAESGYPKLEAAEWFGVFVPAGTPAKTVDALNKAVRDALATEQTKAGLTRLSFEPASSSPTEFAAMIKADMEKWGEIVRASGFTPTD